MKILITTESQYEKNIRGYFDDEDRKRKERHRRFESEIEKWIKDIEKIFSQWLELIIQKKYPFIQGIADIKDIGTHFPDKEEAINITLWADPEYTTEQLRDLNSDLNSFIKMSFLEHRTLLDNEEWTMIIRFFIVHNRQSD